jgi:hypothetical protein
MEDLKLNSFIIMANINSATKEIKVQPMETTDGVVFYHCEIDGEKMSELRNDETWQQVWGSLSDQEIIEIGEQIDTQKKS